MSLRSVTAKSFCMFFLFIYSLFFFFFGGGGGGGGGGLLSFLSCDLTWRGFWLNTNI